MHKYCAFYEAFDFFWQTRNSQGAQGYRRQGLIGAASTWQHRRHMGFYKWDSETCQRESDPYGGGTWDVPGLCPEATLLHSTPAKELIQGSIGLLTGLRQLSYILYRIIITLPWLFCGSIADNTSFGTIIPMAQCKIKCKWQLLQGSAMTDLNIK